MNNESLDFLNEMQESMMEGSDFNDFHSVITIKFGELLESGFDWGGATYYSGNPEFDANHRQRINKKIEDQYYWREICCIPPGQFRHYMIKNLNNIMPKYIKLLELNASGEINPLIDSKTSNKQRDIFTEYPQSMLSGDQDYASTGNDSAGESETIGNVMDKLVDFADLYNDIDVMIVKELAVCFLNLTSLTVDAR